MSSCRIMQRMRQFIFHRLSPLSPYFLSFGDGSRLEIMTRPELAGEETDYMRYGYIHMAVGVGSKEAVDGLTERLRGDGYEIVGEPRTTGDGYYESCVVGPEGNLVEITI